MGGPQHAGATFLADVFGPSTTCPVFICSLINGDAREGGAGAGERFVTTRVPEYISGFARNRSTPVVRPKGCSARSRAAFGCPPTHPTRLTAQGGL